LKNGEKPWDVILILPVDGGPRCNDVSIPMALPLPPPPQLPVPRPAIAAGKFFKQKH
jgi:hypothetical protein